jgi:hypothetical protein
MKILMLYTPRCGSTSILKYYQKVRTECTIINQPWSPLISELEAKNTIPYTEIVSHENVFVKSAIGLFFYKQISYDEVKRDFDKVLVLSRKNHKEQTESLAQAAKYNTFLESSKYLIDKNLKHYLKEMNEVLLDEKSRITELEENLNAKVFYYEDLYYGSFDTLFSFLELDYVEEPFKEFLDIKNRYRLDSNSVKKTKSLV